MNKNIIIPIKFNPIFLLTNYCNAFCPHCHMSAGPHQPKDFIDIKDVLFYLDQFDSQPNFLKSIGFNGGEIMTAYKYHSPDYIPTLIQECVKRNYRIDLRTNALWTEDNTINNLIWTDLDNIDFSNYTSKLSFSMSIDRFHNNETANQKLIARICNCEWRKYCELTAYLIPDSIHGDNRDILSRVVRLLAGSTVAKSIQEYSPIKQDDLNPRYAAGIYLNGIKFMVEIHSIGQWGRAREFGIGELRDDNGDIASQFNIVRDHQRISLDTNSCIKNPPESINIIFSSDGFADFIVPIHKMTAGVPFHGNGSCKPLSELYQEIVSHIQTRFDVIQKKYPNITPEAVNLPILMQKLQHKK